MLTENLEKHFIFVTTITSYARGNPFTWNRILKKLQVNPSKFFQLTRLFLTIWSVVEFLYQAFWMYHALKYNDQWAIHTLSDILYFGGGLIAVPLHILYHFIETNVVVFVNELIQLHRNLEGWFFLQFLVVNMVTTQY